MKVIIIYAALSLICVPVLCLFSFWIGRCSRRLPIIDDGLPWTLRLDEVPRCAGDCAETHDQSPDPRLWPSDAGS
jgi:hypothetical protein